MTEQEMEVEAEGPTVASQWKDKPFTKEDNPGGLAEESSFATLFPKYREKVLKDSWPLVTRALKPSGIACELDLAEGSMTVRTTSKTFDPFAILKARDVIKMLSRGVPPTQAVKAIDDEVFCDVIKIGGYVRSREKFVRRRHRLVGPNGATLKAIELLTGCYVLVQGKTVAAMGPAKGLEDVRRIVVDCMNNIHPVYNIKTLMIKRELAKDPQLAKESWDRFLPKFKKNVVKQKKPKEKKERKPKRVYTPFPPPQQPRKVDLQIESGEYFLSQEERQQSVAAARAEKQRQNAQLHKQERAKSYVAPKEEVRPKGEAQVKRDAANKAGSVEQLKQSIIDKDKKRKLAAPTASVQDFVQSSDAPSAKKRHK